MPPAIIDGVVFFIAGRCYCMESTVARLERNFVSIATFCSQLMTVTQYFTPQF